MIRKVETRFSSLGQVVTAAVLLNLTILSGSPLLLLGSGEYCDVMTYVYHVHVYSLGYKEQVST